MRADSNLSSAYRAEVIRAAQSALQGGCRTLTAICRNCRGAPPTLVSEVLKEILPTEIVAHRAWGDDEPGMHDAALPEMPEPHPADYEWRYTASTADALAEYLAPLGRIACFGTPTVFWRLLNRGTNAVLFDRNPGIQTSPSAQNPGTIHTVDFLKDATEPLTTWEERAEAFDVVLLDPPWYNDHMLVWVRRALRVLRPGGRIVLTMFPDLVRPTGSIDQIELVSTLKGLGRTVDLPFGALYSTPLFEHETLSAHGLADLGQWRRAQFLSVTVPDPDLSFSPPPPIDPIWDRVRLGSQVIVVRRTDSVNGDIAPLVFIPPEVDGSYLLKSVSARHPARKDITVWTSRNRALTATQGKSYILPFLKALELGMSPNVALLQAPDHSRDQLRMLLALIGW